MPDANLGRFAGRWRGTNGFRLMPADVLHSAPATAVVTTAAAERDVVLTYSWNHPDDGPQDGVLLLGAPDEQGMVNAAWGDSWHQQPSILLFAGTLADGRLDVDGSADSAVLWRDRAGDQSDLSSERVSDQAAVTSIARHLMPAMPDTRRSPPQRDTPER